MFTGLITHIGTISQITPSGDGVRLCIDAAMAPYTLGESIAVNGICLTVDAAADNIFEVHATRESLARTNLGRLRPGDGVHLERALRIGDRLGGHFVMGHVDTTAHLDKVVEFSSGKQLSFAFSRDYIRYIVEKGSIAIDGVSLTVNRVGQADFDIMLIPHSQAILAPCFTTPGHLVNIEVDVMGKYVEKLLSCNMAQPRCIEPSTLSIESLRSNGFC